MNDLEQDKLTCKECNHLAHCDHVCKNETCDHCTGCTCDRCQLENKQ